MPLAWLSLLLSMMVTLSALRGCGEGNRSDQSEPVAPIGTASVTLAWDPVRANDLAGYRVYMSTSLELLGTSAGQVSSSVTRFTAGNLQKGTTYFFVVRAFDYAGNESSNSNQVSWTAPPP